MNTPATNTASAAANAPTTSSNPFSSRPSNDPRQLSSKVSRKRSLTKPERFRPKQGMLNRTPSQKTQDATGFREQNESTGNLIQESSSNSTGASTPATLTLSSPAAVAAAQEQQQQRQRIQQANQARAQQQNSNNHRGRPRRMSLRRTGSNKHVGPGGSQPPGGGGAPQRRPSTIAKAKKKLAEREIEFTAWVVVSRIFTCCIPSSMLRCCNGKKFSRIQVVQAWREKVTLCMIIALICGLLAFVIFGLQPTLCPDDSRAVMSYSTQPTDGSMPTKENHIDSVIVRGSVYPFEEMQRFLSGRSIIMSQDFRSRDITALFYDNSMPCSSFPGINVTNSLCTVPNPYNNTPIVAKPCLTYSDLSGSGVRSRGKLSFLWTDMYDTKRKDFDSVIIYDGRVFNVSKYLSNTQVFGSEVTSVLQRSLRKDSSFLFQRTDNRKKAINCLAAMTEIGVLENTTMGCFAAQIIVLTTLICVCMVVGIKFLMALTFSWFLSYRLTEKPRTISKSAKKEKEQQHQQMNSNGQDLARAGTSKRAVGRKNLYTVMLVTCYSEGESSIRTTLDSLANTSYSTKHKLMMVICDGIVRGHGNKMTTPDIVVGMLELAPGNEKPKAASYLAIADGEKQHNMAKVYAGHYVYKKKRVPTVVIVKCGNPLEKDASKPGNRGKRDSQLILMSFFQRVLFADRFTELDFELFHKIQLLMNIWPDRFELCLMVDADTMVKGDSLSYMVTAMQNDHTIMGLCGETKIANKTSSWVTAIQVFEYYISHHLGKAFESVFGGVTCLPGCFCMYRIKSPKNDSWVPILANPEVIQEYNQNIVSTLHQKNLLLLGEDRYLTTLMLRTFPKRQMVFVPQAQCKTVVPDTFSVLLSQRRRWINSTIHNLLELVLVTDLCGIAFLSMQFVVLLELIGTVVLPAAIIITHTLAILPLILIVVIIGLPAVLIVLTTRKWIYVLWMFMYLFSLPIWNFVLPLYSFWHFDDFSWGETRKVANQQKRKAGAAAAGDHGDQEGVFESGSIIMRKWEEWEKERLKAMGYRIQKRHSADRGINDLPPPAASTLDLPKVPRKAASSTNLGEASGHNSSVALTGTVRSLGPHIQLQQNGLGNRAGGAVAGTSTLSLGSTLNGSGSRGSLRVPQPGGRQIANHPMPQSTPNLILSHQQQHQSRQSIAMVPGMGPTLGTRPRSPPPHMLSRPLQLPPPSGGQSFELGPMLLSSQPSAGPGMARASFMPPGAYHNNNGHPPNNFGGAVGLEARHSIHGGAGPGFRPAPSPRPMMMRPPGPGNHGPYPMQRPPPQQSFQGPMAAQGRPRPPPNFSGPMAPPPPGHLFPQQQQQQGYVASNNGSNQSLGRISGEMQMRSAPLYPMPPLAHQQQHGSSSVSSSSNTTPLTSQPLSHNPAAASAATVANTITDGQNEEDGIVMTSDDFHVPSTVADR
ncbi:hypothetical protein EDD11_002954 [Mortierella claussenii]|nr:hypothetical protein EDD11_002954 [Mortierella claussenii]